jgi:hypothetical protein
MSFPFLLQGVSLMKAKAFSIFLFMVPALFIHNVKTEDNQYIIDTIPEKYLCESDKILESFCLPLKFTRSGIRCFLQHTFSRKEYAEDFLPHNFCHLIEFLEYGNQNNQNNVYIQSTIRLFSNKVKACQYISADAFLNVIERFPALLKNHFVKKPTSLLTDAKNAIKRMLYTAFLSKFSFFKNDPDSFFDDLSGDIAEALHNSSFVQTHIDLELLRQGVIKFLEITLNKVIWTPLDQDDVWTSVKAISLKLEDLAHQDIINQDELDDLFQSLVERFIHFLDLAGAELSLNVIKIINQDIDEKTLLFLNLEEQEEFISPKAERLLKALEKTETKILARTQGIIA